MAVEVVHHRKTAAMEVFAEVGDLLLAQAHLARLAEVEEGILEDFLAVEVHDHVGLLLDVKSRGLVRHLQDVLFGVRVIVRPARHPAESEEPSLPSAAKARPRKDEFRSLGRPAVVFEIVPHPLHSEKLPLRRAARHEQTRQHDPGPHDENELPRHAVGSPTRPKKFLSTT